MLWGHGELYIQVLCQIILLFFLFNSESVKLTELSLLQTLTCFSVACSQESLWPMWTPAWRGTRRQPPSTLVRGSTCWTWSPLARQSRRLQTHGNNLNCCSLLVFCPSSSAPIIWSTATPGGLFSKYNLLKWRNVPFSPLYDCCFSFLIFCCLFWESLFFGYRAGTILIWLGQRKKYLKGFPLGTCVLQTRWLNHMKVLCQNEYVVLDL